ncbi:MAG: TylF/MycF/NovP-related O-methyltransferase [Elainellaceae cyanobacterium]
MNIIHRLVDKVVYQAFKRLNHGDKILTDLDFKLYRKRWWGIVPQSGDRPVCKFWWKEKIEVVLTSIEKTEGIGGDIVELGAYKGGGTLLIAEKLKHLRSPRQVWALDSFQGYPAPTEFDRMDDGKFHYAKGHHGDTSAQFVQKVLTLYDADSYVNIREGFFEESVPAVFVDVRQFSLIILDCNHYASTKFCLEFFYERLQPNGIAIIDDYRRLDQLYHPEAPGVKKAVDEFLMDKPEQLQHGAYSMWYFIKSCVT